MKLFLLFSLLATSLMSTDTFASEIPNLALFFDYSSDDDFSGNNNQTMQPVQQGNAQQINIPDFDLENSSKEFNINNRGKGA